MSAPRPEPAEGVFETLLVRDGRVHALDAHLARLKRSVRELYGLAVPAQRIAGRVTAAAAGVRGERRVRVDIVAGVSAVDVQIAVSDVPARRPVSLAPVVIPGGLGPHKWRDRRLVDHPGSAEVPLVLDADGTVLEAAWANVWLLDGDRLITPPADGRLLPGVTRARLLELAPRLGLIAAEEPVTLEQACTASTLFITSALRLAVPARVARHPPESPHVNRIRDALLAASG